jgi:hypothetical protein
MTGNVSASGGQAAADVLFNGIDATTGEPSLPPLSLEAIARLAGGERLDAGEVARLRARAEAGIEMLGAIAGVDTDDLAEAGWAVVFADDADPAVREALQPLLQARRSEAGARKAGRYRELAGPDGYHRGETTGQFLLRQGIDPGAPANPDVFPYYVLLVGGPEQIPFRFQYQLDVTYAVGRLAFDTPGEYATYAAALVAAESSPPARRTVAVFGPRNPDDVATAMSTGLLLEPLAAELAQGNPSWAIETHVGPGQATKAALLGLLTGAEPPSLLLTAGHGMTFPNGHPGQLAHQGALLCQDWPGSGAWRAPIPQDFYLAGDDLPDASGPAGTIAFLFACYGAGTPRDDDFLQSGGAPVRIAPEAFVAGLPRRMLGHPSGAALAVIGHVERAMSYSFAWPRAGGQLDVFQSAFSTLLAGGRVGKSMEFFNDRYAALTTELESVRETISFGGTVDPAEVAGLWTARNDARNYVILGDPAVRLPSSAAP